MLDKNDFQKSNFAEDEAVIAKAMQYLKYVDPDHAAREDAISYLEFMQTVAEQVAKVTPLDFDAFYEDYKKQQAEKER
ncbi:MAG TPA: hypothetical protein VLF69_03140 [Candidatus Saccharimonadales bacterium]|nr:hypothetical protein [Candidatus Saccharimonadales bacterium]